MYVMFKNTLLPGVVSKVLLVLIAVVVIIGGWMAAQYNGLVRTEEQVKTAWGQVEVVYQRRFDLIPGLVEAVRGSMAQEQEVFGAIANARAQYGDARQSGDIEGQMAATDTLNGALGRLLVVMENYPELRSSERVADFMVQLEGTENRISVERGRYNEVVNEYNTQIRVFPTILFARMLGFDEYDRFASQDGASQQVDIDFSMNNRETQSSTASGGVLNPLQ